MKIATHITWNISGANDTDNGNRNDDNIPDSNCSSSEESDNADTPIGHSTGR